MSESKTAAQSSPNAELWRERGLTEKAHDHADEMLAGLVEVIRICPEIASRVFAEALFQVVQLPTLTATRQEICRAKLKRVRIVVLGESGRPRQAVSPEKEAEARALLADGRTSVREVARRLGLPYSTLQAHLARAPRPEGPARGPEGV